MLRFKEDKMTVQEVIGGKRKNFFAGDPAVMYLAKC